MCKTDCYYLLVHPVLPNQHTHLPLLLICKYDEAELPDTNGTAKNDLIELWALTTLDSTLGESGQTTGVTPGFQVRIRIKF